MRDDKKHIFDEYIIQGEASRKQRGELSDLHREPSHYCILDKPFLPLVYKGFLHFSIRFRPVVMYRIQTTGSII